MSFSRLFFASLLSACVVIGSAGKTSADLTVAQGWDLMETVSADLDFGPPLGIQNFVNCPIGSFDFGGSIGVRPTGRADTIVRRDQAATVLLAGQSSNIEVTMLALSLKSVDPFNLFGAGNEFVKATLGGDGDGTFGGSPHNNMTITFDNPNEGTYVVNQLKFDILFTGMTSGSTAVISKTFTTQSTPWRHDPPTGSLQIPGVNRFLKGSNDPAQDFWAEGIVLHDTVGGTHGVRAAGVPEPSAFILTGIAVTACLVQRKRK